MIEENTLTPYLTRLSTKQSKYIAKNFIFFLLILGLCIFFKVYHRILNISLKIIAGTLDTTVLTSISRELT